MKQVSEALYSVSSARPVAKPAAALSSLVGEAVLLSVIEGVFFILNAFAMRSRLSREHNQAEAKECKHYQCNFC